MWKDFRVPVVVFLAAAGSASVGCGKPNTMYGDGTSSVMALHFVADCASSKVDSIDDGKSEARAVALALSLSCYAQYERWCRAVADETLHNNDQKDRLLWRRLSAPMREEMFLPFVLAHRRNKAG